MKFLYLLFLVTSLSQNAFAQKTAQKHELFAYNVLFSGITSAIGAVLNAPKNSNKKQVFIKGLWQGGVGGIINYSSKESLYLINKKGNLVYAWPAKILHSAGNSIIENAALGNQFLQNWHLNVGAVRFDFSLHEAKPFKARLLPEIIYAYYWAVQSGKFNFSKTISTGSFIFQNKNKILISVAKDEFEGYNFGRAIAIGENWDVTNKIIAHELVHEYQLDEYQIFNTWLNPSMKQVAGPRIQKVFNKYIYADVPYVWLPYAILERTGNNYYKNFFEFEAESSATNKYILR